MSQLPPSSVGGGAIRTSTQLLREFRSHGLVHGEGRVQAVEPEVLVHGGAAGCDGRVLLVRTAVNPGVSILQRASRS